VRRARGGAGVVAFAYIRSKRGDPHTVLTMATGSFLTAASRPDLDLEHCTPLAFFARDPQGIIVNADSKYRTFKELLDDAKARPGEIVCAVTEAWSHIEAKKMRVPAVTTESRMPALPDVPTLTELGCKVQIGTGPGSPASAMVGTSGAALARVRLVMPSGRRRPVRMCGMPVSTVAAIVATCPASMSIMAGDGDGAHAGILLVFCATFIIGPGFPPPRE
jgi:hypothetical protein